jgi:hypothetical protein
VLITALACRREEPAPPTVTTTVTDASNAPMGTVEPLRPAETSEPDVRTLVRDFGAKLQMVSLLAPPDVLEKSMREHYAPYVSNALLEQWIRDPASAPGRQVSSPWPDRIEIKSITPDGVVDGEILEVTSARDIVRRIPVRITVVGNRITAFQFITSEAGADEAVAVLDAYYAAIRDKDYERAYRYWSGEGSASGKSFADFKAGFADTATVSIRTGTPGRIDPAAGSRYIEIPVEITAITTAGKTQHFRGKYVLRRSVVNGATEEQRQWRIDSAEIR